FEDVMDLPPAERASRLDALCGDERELHAEVVRLLDADARAGDFLGSPAFHFVSEPKAGRAPLPPGTRLGRYEIEMLVATGGMGEVYRARDPQLDRDVGIKVLPYRDGISDDQLARFRREARAAAALNHPNILTVFDVGIDRDTPFVVAELLEGETLRARMAREPLSIDEATDIARQIASGLAAAHDKGIIHRDLKPGNLFVTADGVVKILDFGLAKQTARPADPTSALTNNGVVMGTAGYMSPEQVRGEEASARSDIFSLGAVLYEMLAGERAFTGASAFETMNAVLTSEPRALKALPPALRAVVARCLASDPANRFSSAHEVSEAWEAAAKSTQSSRTSPRASVSYRVAAAVVLLAAAIAVGAIVQQRQGPPSPGAAGRPALAVLPFDDRSGDPASAWLSTGVASMLVTTLAQTPGLDVIGTERLESSLRDLGRESTDRSARHEVARHAGAGALLVGSLFKVGSETRLDAQVHDVETGRVVAASSHQGTDLFALVDAVASDVRSALDMANRPEGRPLRDVTTTSLDAYELYLKGQRARHNNRWNDARTFFEEALRVDPGFTLARAHLVTALESLGDNAAARQHRPVVASQLHHLPERQRLLTEALQQHDGDPARALELLERLIERYPDEEEAYDSIVHVYSHAYDPAYTGKTLAFMERWARAIPGPGSGHFHNHYGYAYIQRGLFADAERAFRAYIRVSPDEANAYDSLAELYLMTGRPALTVETYDQALRLNPRFGWSHFGRVYSLAMQGKYDEAFSGLTTLHTLGTGGGVPAAVIHLLDALLCSRIGRDADAAAHLDAARRLSRELESVTAAADADLFDAAFSLERGEYARAVERANSAGKLAMSGTADIMRVRRAAVAHLIAGVAEVRAGKLGAARERLAAQRTLDNGSDRFQGSWQQMLVGEIALSEGRFDEAEQAFRASEFNVASSFAVYPAPVALANNFPFRDGGARTALARGDLARAAAVYRRLNQPTPASPWYSVFEPRYALAAADLAERAGNATLSRSERTRFVQVWKGATH
ncbi:MAG TPA: protein kinase, partial [Vicinamibacterales bacterium]|nr:protein kinase [Vicinamibacterales bacterium]